MVQAPRKKITVTATGEKTVNIMECKHIGSVAEDLPHLSKLKVRPDKKGRPIFSGSPKRDFSEAGMEDWAVEEYFKVYMLKEFFNIPDTPGSRDWEINALWAAVFAWVPGIGIDLGQGRGRPRGDPPQVWAEVADELKKRGFGNTDTEIAAVMRKIMLRDKDVFGSKVPGVDAFRNKISTGRRLRGDKSRKSNGARKKNKSVH